MKLKQTFICTRLQIPNGAKNSDREQIEGINYAYMQTLVLQATKYIKETAAKGCYLVVVHEYSKGKKLKASIHTYESESEKEHITANYIEQYETTICQSVTI